LVWEKSKKRHKCVRNGRKPGISSHAHKAFQH